LILSVYYY